MADVAPEAPSVIDTSAAHDKPQTAKAPVKNTKPKPRRASRRQEGSGSEDGGDGPSERPAPAALASLFPSESSTTPAAWADVVDTPENDSPIVFNDLNRGEASRGRGGAVRGRGGRGGKVAREFTEEERKRHEEIKKAKKEKQKAKRKELKETKRKEREAGGKPSADAAGESPDDSLAASTSALTLDDTAAESSTQPSVATGQPTAPGSRGPTGSARGGIVGARNRPAYPQREGNFGATRGMPDYWRGRGGPPRGMPPRGGFRGGPRGRGRGFAHLPFSPQAQAAAAERAKAAAAEASGSPLEDDRAARPQPSIEGKWGHDGYEAMAANDEAMRINRMLRGRGRGRGFSRGGMRGALPFQVSNLPTPEASPDRVSGKVSEGTATQPAAELLLNDSGSVNVRLPGETEAVSVDARPPSQAAEVPPNSTHSPFPPAFTPSNSSPGPYVASDSGSMSSGGYPPSMQMHANLTGEYYGMPSNMRPGPTFYPGANFRPQSFTPEPNVPTHQRGSFSAANAAPFYPTSGASFTPPGRARADSPLNPYAGQRGGFGRSQDAGASTKPGSKSPVSADDVAGETPLDGQHDQQGYPAGYYQFNPYAGGVDAQGMYYPQQGYWPQQGYEQGAYGYQGEYHGY